MMPWYGFLKGLPPEEVRRARGDGRVYSQPDPGPISGWVGVRFPSCSAQFGLPHGWELWSEESLAELRRREAAGTGAYAHVALHLPVGPWQLTPRVVIASMLPPPRWPEPALLLLDSERSHGKQAVSPVILVNVSGFTAWMWHLQGPTPGIELNYPAATVAMHITEVFFPFRDAIAKIILIATQAQQVEGVQGIYTILGSWNWT
jgi:hypothetical protein